jgi:uncharacterized protein YbjT (DUF2867 family)
MEQRLHHEPDNAQTNVDSVLVVGASGSIGCLAVAEALRAGFTTTALIRDANQASLFPKGTRVVVGDPTRADTLADALDGVNGIVFTQGTYRDDDAEQVNYRPVHAILDALTSPTRIALMTALGVTKPTPGHDWKRRGERLVRASGLPYTIVRPGWFDYNEPDEHHLVMLQGDTRWAGNSSDGVVSRQQIAEVLIASLTNDEADHKTFELVAEKGDAQPDLAPVFAALQPDDDAALDGPKDRDTLPLSAEPERVVGELDAIRGRF